MSTLSVSTITDASGGNTATINSYTPTESNMAGRNRIINGAMVINQRALGTTTAAGNYILDRFVSYRSGGAYTVQQSSTAPAGFTNSMLMTNTTAASPTTYSFFAQIIEGYNVADLGFGTASAQTITVSFWVRSSVTGIYSISVTNGDNDRAYPAQYTINSADTWEYKTITLPGDTSGTWATNNTKGIFLRCNLGSPSARTAAAGAWVAGNYDGADGSTGATTWANTTGATFYITGVQLEAGSVATPFEYRMYGQELALCQRYYEQTTSVVYKSLLITYSTGGSNDVDGVDFMVSKRTTPTCTISAANDAANRVSYYNSSTSTFTVSSIGATPERITRLVLTTDVTRDVSYKFTASAEL